MLSFSSFQWVYPFKVHLKWWMLKKKKNIIWEKCLLFRRKNYVHWMNIFKWVNRFIVVIKFLQAICTLKHLVCWCHFAVQTAPRNVTIIQFSTKRIMHFEWMTRWRTNYNEGKSRATIPPATANILIRYADGCFEANHKSSHRHNAIFFSFLSKRSMAEKNSSIINVHFHFTAEPLKLFHIIYLNL